MLERRWAFEPMTPSLGWEIEAASSGLLSFKGLRRPLSCYNLSTSVCSSERLAGQGQYSEETEAGLKSTSNDSVDRQSYHDSEVSLSI
jgi:hypothetical protein